MNENTVPDFKRLFEVAPNSPTGLKWRDDVNEGITGRGKNLHAGKPAGVRKETTQRRSTINVLIKGKAYVVSRIIWELTHGPIPEDMVIDHLDGNPLNNALSNLACKTRAGNMRNRKKPKNNKSGIVGVRKQGGSWVGTYKDENQKDQRASFSTKTYGEAGAFDLAVRFRLDGLKRMNQDYSFEYTDRHIGWDITGVLSPSNIQSTLGINP